MTRLKKHSHEFKTEPSRGAAGARSSSGSLKVEGEPVGCYRSVLLMAEAGLVSKQSGHTRLSWMNQSMHRIFRTGSLTQKNRTRSEDVTYTWPGTQWVYLATVMDLRRREIIGWAMSDSPDSALTATALTVADESRRRSKGAMFHSDQGCHYSSK